MSSVWFGKFDFSGDPAQLLGGLRFAVDSYSHSAIGGPKAATVKVAGDPLACQELYGLLACQIVLYNDYSEAVWWGEVTGVETARNGILTRLSLDDVYNKIRLDYVVDTGADQGLSTTTGWSSDSTSITRYRTRELILQKGRLPVAAAANFVATELARRKDPWPQEIGEGKDGAATIFCKGYWYALGRWHLARTSLALAASEVITGSAVETWPHNDNEWWQGFTVAAAVTDARLVEVFMRRMFGIDKGDATDTQGFEIYLSSAVPFITVGNSAEVFASDLPETWDWVPFLLTANASLSATLYYVVIGHRSGGGGAFVQIRMDETLAYTGGAFTKYQAGGHITRSPNADMVFAVYRFRDSMNVLGDLATIVSADTLVGFDLDPGITSGVSLLEVCQADQNLLDRVQEIIDQGTTNSRRVLASVKSDRRLRVYEEPAAGTADWLRESYQIVRDNLGNPVDLSTCPVGMWLARTDPSVTNPIDGGPLRGFVEEAECRVTANGVMWRPTFRGQPDIFDFTVLRTLGLPI